MSSTITIMLDKGEISKLKKSLRTMDPIAPPCYWN